MSVSVRRLACRGLLAGAVGLAAVTAVAQDAVTVLLDQARTEFNAGRHAEALATYDRAVDLVTKTRGPEARQLADVLAMKGFAHAMLGDRESARTLTQRSVAILQKSAGPGSREAVMAPLMLGAMHVNFNEIDAAKAIYAQAVADARTRFGESDAATLQVTESAAQAAMRWGDAAEAVRLRRLVLSGREQAHGRDALETIAARSNLAHFLHAAGDTAAAEQAFEEVLGALGRRGMKDSGEAAAVRSNLGAMLVQRGEHAKGLAALEAALATWTKAEGRDSPAVATIRATIAGAKMELGRNEEAVAEFREIVAGLERTTGPDSPATLTAVNNLANVLTRVQKSADAVPLLERVAAGLRKTAPANDPRVLSADANLAAVYRLVGRGADAVRLGEATLVAREKLLPPGHTDLGDSFGNLADTLMFTGDFARAVEMTDREQQSDRLRDARILPALTDAEQATFLAANTVNELGQALNVALQARGVVRATERSAAWLANAKGRGAEAAAARMEAARAAADPARAARLAELATVRRQMATLVQAPPQAAGAAPVPAQLETLADRERVLVRELGLAAAADRTGDWVAIEAIRAALPRTAVLVDLARFDRLDFTVPATGRRVHEPHYVAWLVPAAGAGEVAVVDLGDARPIDEAVAAFRKALEEAAGADGGPPAVDATAEERLRDGAARALAALVLDPILAGVARAAGDAAATIDELVIAPDGPLWLVPWAALPTADGGYLVERHAVRLVTAGRDVAGAAARPDAPQPRAPALVFAAPEFDLAPAALAAALTTIDRGRPADAAAAAAPGPAARAAGLRLPKVAPLPGTRAEVATIEGPLEALTGGRPEVFLGEAAQETVLKRKATRPAALVLATHGYFLGAAAGGESAPVVNPLLRCGLLLAGANTAAEPRAADLDDGVLTGLEVAGLDLAGTRLVVLSACETGIGDVQVGEGVAGLRQAFQIAGAATVVATLWQIPDAESAQIMQDFYANLEQGAPAAKALRDAQLAFIKARREDRTYEAAHPYLWAAYGVTGR